MDAEKLMRNQVKKYVDVADVKVVKMMYAMLEVNSEEDWWDTMPNNIKADLETSIEQSIKGQIIPHSEIKKRLQKWNAK